MSPLTRFGRAARAAYASGLRAPYSRRVLPWMAHAERVRIDPRVRHLVPHHSEPGVAALIRRRVAPGSVALDIGSFLGVYAVIAARCAGASAGWWHSSRAPGAPPRRHFGYNDLHAPRMRLIEAAVSDTPGRALLHESPKPYVNSLAASPDASVPGASRHVDVVSIDDVCRRLGMTPSFIRMDVQGVEVHALRGARDTLRAAGGDLTILVETHPQCWPAFGVDEVSLRATLRDLDLEPRPLEPGAPVLGRDAHVVVRKAGAFAA